MAMRKFGDSQPIEPVREEDDVAADEQGINVTSVRHDPTPYEFGTVEIIHEGTGEDD